MTWFSFFRTLSETVKQVKQTLLKLCDKNRVESTYGISHYKLYDNKHTLKHRAALMDGDQFMTSPLF